MFRNSASKNKYKRFHHRCTGLSQRARSAWVGMTGIKTASCCLYPAKSTALRLSRSGRARARATSTEFLHSTGPLPGLESESSESESVIKAVAELGCTERNVIYGASAIRMRA